MDGASFLPQVSPTSILQNSTKNRPGVILLITLVILVILATLGYTLTARVVARRHRDQYVIDYSQARYACASALKYAMTSVSDLDPQLISRPNEPDFSDVFAMTELEYQKFLADFALDKKAAERHAGDKQAESDANAQSDQDARAKRKPSSTGSTMQGVGAEYGDANDINDVNDTGAASLVVPGPYGPPWPLVTEALECEIGSAKVKIEIEDENAKYPLNWALITDDKWKALADTGLATFCEWMGYTPAEITGLRKDLDKIGEFRSYQLEFKPLTKAAAPTPPSVRSRVSRPPSTAGTTRTTGAAASAPRTLARTVVSPAEQMEQQNVDFAKLFHSSFVDADLLSRPSIASDTRHESAMKYLGLWTVRQVNVNTAPRNVLEAALTFGSAADAPKIAGEIIRLRQEKPFTDIEEVKKGMFRFSDSIEKCKEFLTTTSTVFTIRVTAVSGVAKVTAIAAVSKEGNNVKQIGVVSD
jgi:hypothetical protein